MAKKLNIELTVRRMEAQSILTTSGQISERETLQQWAPEREAFHPYTGLAPIREGF